MDFAAAIWTCFAKFATFEGRASRMEFWSFAIFVALGTVIAFFADDALFPGHELSPLGMAFSLVIFLPSMAVTARRLHDIGKSGWLQLNGVLPIVGWVFLMVWACRSGTVGPNRYGTDPSFSNDYNDEEEDDDLSEEVARRVLKRFAKSEHWRAAGQLDMLGRQSTSQGKGV